MWELLHESVGLQRTAAPFEVYWSRYLSVLPQPV